MIKGTFSQVSLLTKDSVIEVPLGWFAISYAWVNEKRSRRLAYARWFKISSGQNCVFRSLKFSANLKGSEKIGSGQISIDWGAWLSLTDFPDDVPSSLELEITPARFWDYPRIIISHPNPSDKLAAQIALVSLFLGIVSLF